MRHTLIGQSGGDPYKIAITETVCFIQGPFIPLNCKYILKPAPAPALLCSENVLGTMATEAVLSPSGC